MKKFYFILLFILTGFFANAQGNQQPNEKTQQDIEALKVAFITKELELTPEEAQKFWPVYNQYSKEKAAVKDNNKDVLDRDEKILNIRKKYKDQFIKIIGQDRTNKLYGAEGRFHKLLIKAAMRNKRMQEKPNRSFQKGNE